MSGQQAGPGLDLLRSDVRRRLYCHLADLPTEPAPEVGGVPPRERGLSAQELAHVVGLHLTTVRFHLDQLVAAGLLRAVQAPPAGAGRPRKLYAVPAVQMTAPTDPEALQAYTTLSEIVATAGVSVSAPGQTAGSTDDERTPAALEQSGWDWAQEHAERLAVSVGDPRPATTPGGWLGKIGAVLDLLVGWGHSPEVRTSAGAREVDILLRDCPFMALARDNPHMVCGVHRGLLRGALDALGEASSQLDLQPLVDRRTCRAHLTVTTPFPDRGEQR